MDKSMDEKYDDMTDDWKTGYWVGASDQWAAAKRGPIKTLTAEVERLTNKTLDHKDAINLKDERIVELTHNGIEASMKRDKQITTLKAALEARNDILKTCYDDVGVGGYIIEQIEALKKNEAENKLSM